MEKLNFDNNRWSINKIGLLNYWCYDEEEFEFADGRMILRGANGSGKSVTMQSFIPLLLDGNKSPERLDPFNSRSRKIEDYVLGYGDNIKDENISYLYMELKKKETDNFLTIGMGLKGKKGKGVEFWGFIIKDLRRIGKDIYLYKDVNNKIPLTKQELKNRIGEGGQVVNTQKEYAKLVNENIFGFETDEEYEDFIKLLIEIRTPKLSKEGFKPSIITEIMSKSLQELSDEDLRYVSESIENMNNVKDKLEMIEKSQNALKNLNYYYDMYNKFVLYRKARKYKQINKELNDLNKQRMNLKQEVLDDEKRLGEIKSNILDQEMKFNIAKENEKNLRNNELWNKKEQINNLEEKLKNDLNTLKQKEEVLSHKQKNEYKIEDDIKNNSEIYEKLKKEFDEITDEMLEMSQEFKFDEFSFVIDEINKQIDKLYDYKTFENELKLYINKIEVIKESLEKEILYTKEYDKNLQEYDKLKNAKVTLDNKIDKAREYFNTLKDEFIDKFQQYESKNIHLKISEEIKSKIYSYVNNYNEPYTYDDIKQQVREVYNEINDKYKDELIKLKNSIQAKKEEIAAKKEEILEWRKIREPEPLRDEAVILNRKKLIENGITFMPLYNLIEFKSDISDADKNNVESALLDSGLLDALVIPKEELNKALKLDVDFVDKYIIPNPTIMKNDLSYLFDITIPEGINIKSEYVDEILRTILTYDEQTNSYNQVYIDEKGNYLNGIIKGRANTNYTCKYIGIETRKNTKKKIIEELENDIDILNTKIEEISLNVESIEDILKDLDLEFKNIPLKDDLDVAYSILKEEIINMNSLKSQIEIKNSEVEISFNKLKECKEKTREFAINMYIPLTHESYKEAYNVALEFKEKLYKIINIQTNLVNKSENILSLKESLENVIEDVDNLKYEIDILNNNIKINTAKIKEIRELLNTSNFNELSQKIEECQRVISDFPKIKGELERKLGSLENDVKNKEDRIISLEKDVVLQQTLNNVSYDIVRKEIDLFYVYDETLFKNENNELTIDDKKYNELINQVIKDYKNFENESKNETYYLNTLIEKYMHYSDVLVEQNISIDDIFLPNENRTFEDIETKELISSQVRKDITGYINGRRVNLKVLFNEITISKNELAQLIEQKDREIFEDILTNTVGRKIRAKIYKANEWVKNMNALMESLNTSSGLSFSINWKPKTAQTEEEIDTRELVDILNSDASLLREEESKKISKHFRSKISKAEAKSKEQGVQVSFHANIKEVLDYRNWFEFVFMYKRAGETKKELTNNIFYKFSGGEKAMAMYVPLFASVYSRYDNAKKDCLRIISLDEAFAGVDDKNITDMFRVLTELKLDYIINSQVLWGDYETIPQIAISELIKPNNVDFVTILRYKWDGKKRILLD